MPSRLAQRIDRLESRLPSPKPETNTFDYERLTAAAAERACEIAVKMRDKGVDALSETEVQFLDCAYTVADFSRPLIKPHGAHCEIRCPWCDEHDLMRSITDPDRIHEVFEPEELL